MDKIKKALKRFSQKERDIIKSILTKIKKNDLKNLDIKKLKKRNNIFRARRGKIRIIYCKQDEKVNILVIERRSETTYKF